MQINGGPESIAKMYIGPNLPLLLPSSHQVAGLHLDTPAEPFVVAGLALYLVRLESHFVPGKYR